MDAKVTFHIYKPAQFVTNANKFLDLRKEAKSVEKAATELKEIESQRQSSRETAAALADFLRVAEPNPGSKTILELLSAVKPNPSASEAYVSLANLSNPNASMAAYLAELVRPNASAVAASANLADLLRPRSILSAQLEEVTKHNATVSAYLESLTKPSPALPARLEDIMKFNATVPSKLATESVSTSTVPGAKDPGTKSMPAVEEREARGGGDREK